MVQISKADLHIHTHYSDGTMGVPELLAHVAREQELAVIAVTDHDTIAGAQEARRLAPSFGVEVIVGEEVSTADGHLLALFIEERLPPGTLLSRLSTALRRSNGRVILMRTNVCYVPSLPTELRIRETAGPPRASSWTSGEGT